MSERETRYTLKQFLPMRIALHFCGADNHFHSLVGVLSDDIGPLTSGIWDDEEEVWFLPLVEQIHCLN